MQETKRKSISPYLLVLLSFLVIILLGSFLLTIPFARKDGNWGTYIDALFTATSSTCVTGLCSYQNGIGNELTLFGQIVVLIMIQIGGLGFITVLTFFITLFSKLQFKDRYFLSQAVNSTNVADVGKFVRKIILISFTGELIGFLLGLPVFFNVKSNLPGFSTGDVIWYSLFTSISMFNNAGFDIFGGTSMIRNVGNVFIDSMDTWAYYLMCSYTMLLIIIGGLSFLVVIEVFSFKKKPTQWRAFTKIVLTTTTFLLLFGFVVFCLTECTKATDKMDPFQALFQSVTCRTAGAAIYDQDSLTTTGKLFSCFLMFIGGSPLSTAGGIKTTTIFLIGLAVFCFLRGKKVAAFKRQYSQNMILKAMSLVFIALLVLIISFIAMINFEASNSQAYPENIVFELFSAFGTVGLSASLTPTLTLGSKIILCLLMFLGRLGPITMFQIFQRNMNKETDMHYAYIEEDFLIG